MSEFLHQLLEPQPLAGLGSLLIGFVTYVLLGLVPVLAVLYLIYYLLTLPMKRSERARFFLDLLDLGLKSGQSAEGAIADAASSGDPTLGSRFHLLAGHLKGGDKLGQGLERVPGLVPPQVCAMLKVGERLGDIGRVLPACRLSLHGAASQVRGALNYLLVLAFLATPFMLVVPVILKVKVLAPFKAIFSDMTGGALLPGLTRWVLDSSSWIIGLQVASMALVWLLTFAYLGGPRLRLGLGRVIPGGPALVDLALSALPWRQRRLQRDFSAMLAVLLEAGVPEAEALRLAGEATANLAVRHRAEKAIVLLTRGTKLPDALATLDASGELRWRLTTALHSGGGFVRALRGWHEALDAKAFQLEQMAAQTMTTVLVLLNGLIVASIVIGMFLPLVQILNRITLW